MTFTGHTQVGIVMILVKVDSRVSSKTEYGGGEKHSTDSVEMLLRHMWDKLFGF